ncbi:poly-gamma-glutamate hydrolase family protein [Streptomyces sp. NPDC001250]|uniref:poly-gamma-glutamate hydrolase family protein n=1 Tax=Streptomyces sp. NPDC001250 TaxID=3154382 RepID=UPI003333DCAB
MTTGSIHNAAPTASDTYSNFADLAAHEDEGLHWTRECRRVPGSDLAHIAIHGGHIEAGTTEAALACAGSADNYYSFKGIKTGANRTLHVTSTDFDEPQCVDLQSGMARTVSWHGFSGGDKITEVGGLDHDFSYWITVSLQHAGFPVAEAAPERAGSSPLNICNRNLAGRGVQLELSRAQRAAFFMNNDMSGGNRNNVTAEFHRYVEAIQAAYRRLRA